jgi:hypothetical protein
MDGVANFVLHGSNRPSDRVEIVAAEKALLRLEHLHVKSIDNRSGGICSIATNSCRLLPIWSFAILNSLSEVRAILARVLQRVDNAG